MVPKRKRDEADAIIYGSSIPWLQSLIEPTSKPISNDLTTVSQSPQLTIPADEEVVWEASKLVYLLYHQLDVNDLPRILETVDISARPELGRKLSLKQTQWKSTILNKFMLPHVQEQVRKWHVANPWRTFASLATHERYKVWMAPYRADPKRSIMAMFKPVIGVLDIAHVFDETSLSSEDRAKMKAIRFMLRNKYLYGCEITYKNRVLADKKDSCFQEWATYAEDPSFLPTIVEFADFPVHSKLLPSDLNTTAKKSSIAEGEI